MGAVHTTELMRRIAELAEVENIDEILPTVEDVQKRQQQALQAREKAINDEQAMNEEGVALQQQAEEDQRAGLNAQNSEEQIKELIDEVGFDEAFGAIE